MIKNISVAAGRALARQAECSEEKEEILVYMIIRLLTNTLFFAFLFILSSFLEIRLTTFVTLVAFLLIRRCFGGWHVNNSYVCLTISIIIPLLAGYISTIYNFSIISIAVIYVVATIIAFNTGVVDNENKRLKESRKEKFKKQGMITLAIIILMNVWVLTTGNIIASNAMVMGVVLGFSNLLIAKK